MAQRRALKESDKHERESGRSAKEKEGLERRQRKREEQTAVKSSHEQNLSASVS